MLNYIESKDLFGQPIHFTFNKKGTEHKTVFGGCFSILVRILLLGYTVILAQRMVFYGKNNNETFTI